MRKFKYKSVLSLLLILGIGTSCGKSEATNEQVNNEQSSNEISEVETDNIVENNGEVEELTIFEVTDIHYISNNINDKGEAFQRMLNNADGRQTYYIEELTDALVYDIQQKQPDVLIVSGDLTHNGEKESHIEIAKKLAKIEESGTTVLVTAGNHDIDNPYAREFKGSEEVVVDSVTPEEFEQIYSEFGFSEAASRDEKSLSYLSKVSDDLWVLMLDTNLYAQNTDHPVTNGILKKSTLEWAKECGVLATENNAEILGVMHHNLYNHSDLLHEGFTIGNSKDVLKALKATGVNLVLSGHIHIQDIASDVDNTVYDIATSGFVVYPVTYGKLVYSKDKGFNYTTADVDVEGWAKSVSSTDSNLLNFAEYSRDHFYDQSVSGVYKNLSEKGTLTDEEAKAMAEAMATLNVYYFGGNVSQVDKDLGSKIADSVGYKLWIEHADEFFSEYVISMEEAKTRLTTNLELDSEDLKK